MPIYIKEIRGNLYYYEQYSVYQGPGLPPLGWVRVAIARAFDKVRSILQV